MTALTWLVLGFIAAAIWCDWADATRAAQQEQTDPTDGN